MPPAIELIGIDKRFGAVHANRNVNLTVEAGTIHGIVGENGAGKSTLMSILYGFYEADRGEIKIAGKTVRIASSRAAIALGLGMVHQHFMLVEPLSVLDNVMLGAEGGAILSKGAALMRARLAELGCAYGLEVDPDALISDLSVGMQQRVEILKALVRGAEVLVLDEPTAVLTPPEADQLFSMLRVLRGQGKTIILITHKLREITDVTDRVSVMRRGEIAAHFETARTNVAELADAMVGRKVVLRVVKGTARPGAVLLEARGITIRDERGVTRADKVSFSVRAGEIVGIAGVSGNGQSELLEALAGIRRVSSGAVFVAGEDTTGADAAAMRARGLAHVPEDRHHMGLVLPFEENENFILGYHHDRAYGGGLGLDLAKMRGLAREKIVQYDVQPPDCRLKTANFSGGNQQKIVLSREIERDPKVLLVGQPTRGVDIGAIEFIHRRLIELRDAGKAILLVSVELDEIMSLSDRIIVMCGGRVTGERDAAGADVRDLGLLMAGVSERAA